MGRRLVNHNKTNSINEKSSQNHIGLISPLYKHELPPSGINFPHMY